MSFPADLKYTTSHEWVRVEGDLVTVGITSFAQEQLGDVVHVELPTVGDTVSKGEACCEIESVKAVSDVYSPVGGEIAAVNEELDGAEDQVNAEPYGSGWLFRVRADDVGQLGELLDAASYEGFVSDQ